MTAPAPAGFVKIPRTLLLEPWARRPACLALFAHLLARANLEPKEWNGIRIDRGQLVTSRRSLAAETGISEKCVRSALLELERYGRAHQEAHGRAHAAREGVAHGRAHGFTIVTICEFNTYSGSFVEAGPPQGPRETAAEAHEKAHQRATTKEYKNIYLDSIRAEDPAFADILDEWLGYRQEIGKPYKSERSMSAALAQLRKHSGGDPATARQIVQQSIANAWQGLFPIKDGSSARRASTPTAADRREINANDKFITTL